MTSGLTICIIVVNKENIMIERILAKCEPGTTVAGTYINSKTPVDIKCKNGHNRSIIWNNLNSRGSGATCKECLGINKYNKKSDALIAKQLGTFKLMEPYKGALFSHLIECEKGHQFKEYINRVKICKECNPSTHRSIKNTFSSELDVFNIVPVSEYVSAKTEMLVRYPCEHEGTILPSNFTSYATGSVCRICNPIYSKKETALLSIVKGMYNGWIIERDKTILGNGQELDIVIPDKGLAIEFNGTYWHSTERHNKDYHSNKTNIAIGQGYRLLHISEYEFDNKLEIVKSRIRSSLGKNTTIYARKCDVREIQFPGEFLDTNHIQGAGAATSINYGLFLCDELVAVMTFSKSRFSKHAEYELVRYCSLLDINIVGGASKLLSAFLRRYGNVSIISYSDRRWSIGNLYLKLGFRYSHTSEPGYAYYKDKERLSRYVCQKHLLKDRFPDVYSDERSEHEIMKLAGYYKVYDSGNDVWLLNT